MDGCWLAFFWRGQHGWWMDRMVFLDGGRGVCNIFGGVGILM